MKVLIIGDLLLEVAELIQEEVVVIHLVALVALEHILLAVVTVLVVVLEHILLVAVVVLVVPVLILLVAVLLVLVVLRMEAEVEIRLQGTYRIYRRGKAKFGIADV